MTNSYRASVDQDGASGIPDMMIAACDQFRYEFFGHKGPHASCSENLCVAMRREGHQVDVIPQPINFFTNTYVDRDGSFSRPRTPCRLAHSSNSKRSWI